MPAFHASNPRRCSATASGVGRGALALIVVSIAGLNTGREVRPIPLEPRHLIARPSPNIGSVTTFLIDRRRLHARAGVEHDGLLAEQGPVQAHRFSVGDGPSGFPLSA